MLMWTLVFYFHLTVEQKTNAISAYKHRAPAFLLDEEGKGAMLLSGY